MNYQTEETTVNLLQKLTKQCLNEVKIFEEMCKESTVDFIVKFLVEFPLVFVE